VGSSYRKRCALVAVSNWARAREEDSLTELLRLFHVLTDARMNSLLYISVWALKGMKEVSLLDGP